MRPEEFFALFDDILVENKRKPLEPGSPQRAIVEVRGEDRVLQILAGPGSGKTEMLVWRILYELFVLKTPAERLLVTTFTRKAATELEVRLVERADSVMAHARQQGIAADDPHIHDLPVGTLHSLCDRLMREFDDAYMADGTQLIDEHESTVRLAREYRFTLGFETRSGQPPRVINRLIDCEPLTALFRAPWESDDRWPGSNMDRVAYIRALLDQHTETWIPRCAAAGTPNGVESVPDAAGVTEQLVTMQQRWVEYLDAQNVLDFATVQQRFLERQPVILPEFDHVFVDEFQDTNPIQYAIHRGWLAAADSRLTVVGDDDQSIYRFRGSDINCFIDLGTDCAADGVPFRQEVLDRNYRSTENIVAFNEAFRRRSALAPVTMPKQLRPGADVEVGAPMRLLTGAWEDICAVVAAELRDLSDEGAAQELPLDAAVLLFSTSEKSGRNYSSTAGQLRDAMETRGLRVYNPRNKTAGRVGSPVHDLLALISYLIDPVTKAQVNGRRVEVHATHREAARWPYAVAVAPFRIADTHAAFQKQFRKSDGGNIDNPSPQHQPLLDYLDDLREALVNASRPGRMSLAGLVARLLTFPRFRGSGYSVNLFRQALFTALLEANVAPTRRTTRNLDEPMAPTRNANGKIEWPRQYWDLLNVFAGMLYATDLDDEEVEAFADQAVAMLTFHQAKGLEYDHVFVGCTGRNVTTDTVLRTALFSGRPVRYQVTDGHAETADGQMLQWAAADRDREVYVALTRAKRCLTIMYAPDDERNFMALNPGIAAVLDDLPSTPHPQNPAVTVTAFDVNGAR